MVPVDRSRRRLACRSDHEGWQLGLVNNLIVGVIGAILGGVLFSLIGLKAYGLVGQLVTATVGALVLLFLLKKLAKK